MRFAVLTFCICFGLVVSAEDFRIATWNLEWFFDEDTGDNSQLGAQQSAPSEQEYEARVTQIAKAIESMDVRIIALQEIENQQVVDDVVEELNNDSRSFSVQFVQGLDTFTGQDVAFLVDSSLSTSNVSRFTRDSSDPNQPRNVSKHLRIDTSIGGEDVTLITAHLIATSSNRRRQQARTLRTWITPLIGGNLIVLGDLNSRLDPGDMRGDTDLGIILGFGTPSTDDDLVDSHTLMPGGVETATHVGGSALDRVFLSQSLSDSTGLRVAASSIAVQIRKDLAIVGAQDGAGTNGRSVAYQLGPNEQDASDHFPVIVNLTTDGRNDERSLLAGMRQADDASEAVTTRTAKVISSLLEMLEQLD